MAHHKLYYSISEVANLLGLNPSLIRYWEKEFDSLQPIKNSRGDRRFQEKDIIELRRIYQLLKVDKLTMQGAKLVLNQKEGQVDTIQQVIDKLQQLKISLQQLL